MVYPNIPALSPYLPQGSCPRYPILTPFLDQEAQRRGPAGQSPVQTVIVGEGQQVTVSVRIAKQYIQARDLVYHTQQPRELLKASHRSAG